MGVSFNKEAGMVCIEATAGTDRLVMVLTMPKEGKEGVTALLRLLLRIDDLANVQEFAIEVATAL